MYKKGAALELQFSPARLNDGAGDPYWIDLTEAEARHLHEQLGAYLQQRTADGAGSTQGGTSPLVVVLDTGRQADVRDVSDVPGALPAEEPAAAVDDFKQWACVICGWIYDEALGDPEHDVPAGTRWADVPDDWRCPLCDVGKEDFALVEF